MSRLGYKVAIVTGGAQDFGAGAAEALATDGATVLLTGLAGEAHADALRARGLKAEYHQLDAADPLSWAALVDKIMCTHGHLDVLVNQAGANISCTIEDDTAAQLHEILDENLLGPFLGTKAVIPAMRQSGGGSIINIAANAIRSTKAKNLHPLLAALPARGPTPLQTFSTAITFLAADESAHITGTELYCAGVLAAQNFAEPVS